MAGSAAAGVVTVSTGADALKEACFSSVSLPGEVLLFSPNDHLSDLFLPLHADGRLKGLTLVVPSEKSFTEQDLASWKSYTERLFPGTDNAFSLNDGAFSGEIRGLRVTVFPLKGWDGRFGKGTVVLDLSFFESLHKDEARTPFTEIPVRFLGMLADRKIDPSRIHPWLADRSALPLEHGYLPGLVISILQAPETVRKGLPPRWRSLKTGEYLAWLAMTEQAVAHFEKYLVDDPDEPSVLFRIALLHFDVGDATKGLRFLHRAHKADGYYIRGYADAAFLLFRKGDLSAAERVVRAGLYVDPAFPDLKFALGRILLAEAKKMLHDNPAAAEERFSEIEKTGISGDAADALGKEWEAAKAAPSSAPAPHMGH